MQQIPFCCAVQDAMLTKCANRDPRRKPAKKGLLAVSRVLYKILHFFLANQTELVFQTE